MSMNKHTYDYYNIVSATKDCSSKFRSKRSTNTVLCLLRNLVEQSLGRYQVFY
jgi:hypothetical protein